MKELIKALHRGAVDKHRCLGCEFEENCGIHGCQVMKRAADLLERQWGKNILTVVEQQAIFRLGQMDMQQSAVQMLRDLADSTTGMARTNLRAAAECVEKLHVSKSNTGGDDRGNLGN